MAEKDFHKALRTWVYNTYGEIKIDALGNSTGRVKIVKLSMLAQYGEAGAPDWAIFVKHKPAGYTFFFELKNPDGSGECTDKQLLYHAWLRALGFKVYVVDSMVQAKELFRSEMDRLGGRNLATKRTPFNYL